MPVKVHLIIKKSSIILCVNCSLRSQLLHIRYAHSVLPLNMTAVGMIHFWHDSNIINTHTTESPNNFPTVHPLYCQERRTFLHFIQKPHALLDCFSLCSKRVNFNERGRNGRKCMINKLIHLSFLPLEPRGERQRAAPFCAACGLLDHAQRIPMECILQGGS